jgi:glycosyltransferase involved in cell wall biosynthesis
MFMQRKTGVTSRTFLAAVGDTNNPVTWSGIPYHFLQSARAAGLIDKGLRLSTDGGDWQVRRLVWNATRVARGDRHGGYQYSSAFLERLWSSSLPEITGGAVINCFQLFPPSVVKDPNIIKWFFIDQTLLQLFDYYDQRRIIGRQIAREAIDREREGYHAAAGIIAHSNWAAESLLRAYGVPHHRVHIVVPGANLDAQEYKRWEMENLERDVDNNNGRPLQLVFVGKYWERKGLDRLLGALIIGRRSGLRATLRVIGCNRDSLPTDLRDVAGVEWLGFINKRTESARFFRSVSECDVGCLLSRTEAGGIALREYHALGLVVLGTDSGGAPEHMIPNASIVVPVRANEDKIASILLALETDTEQRAKLQSTAWRNRHNALWEKSVSQIVKFWPTSQLVTEMRDGTYIS